MDSEEEREKEVRRERQRGIMQGEADTYCLYY